MKGDAAQGMMMVDDGFVGCYTDNRYCSTMPTLLAAVSCTAIVDEAAWGQSLCRMAVMSYF